MALTAVLASLEQRRLHEHQVALAIASDYMRLSRSPSLAQVYDLFALDAAYHSEALGTTCEELGAIRQMMDAFFHRFPDVRWEVTSMRVVEPGEPRPASVRVAVQSVRRVRSPQQANSPLNSTLPDGIATPPAQAPSLPPVAAVACAAAAANGDAAVAEAAGVCLEAASLEQRRLHEHQVALAIASDYMRLSRSPSLAQVYDLFALDAAYHSEALGTTCEELGAIRQMMDAFFHRFPDVRWEVTSMRVVEPGEPRPASVRVAVQSVRYWTSEAGEALVRSGREWIFVEAVSGRITYVHVAPLDP
ncbi:hypothetical protein TSOC_001520 [Tetrabaena socialis]|uniref:SnoaL-like domain-containing protein n=1 Tax=Tetrabaena socialis TaxID=47790 RepID=A0A2J8AGI4_9CHLO|nr:hypothetical protein TSOC_001520 [Tetrabaena socialis]|eukprot:PNH11633.1 hypothetical protein TSOC_001520 [Tetrabaena socialis]